MSSASLILASKEELAGACVFSSLRNPSLVCFKPIGAWDDDEDARELAFDSLLFTRSDTTTVLQLWSAPENESDSPVLVCTVHASDADSTLPTSPWRSLYIPSLDEWLDNNKFMNLPIVHGRELFFAYGTPSVLSTTFNPLTISDVIAHDKSHTVLALTEEAAAIELCTLQQSRDATTQHITDPTFVLPKSPKGVSDGGGTVDDDDKYKSYFSTISKDNARHKERARARSEASHKTPWTGTVIVLLVLLGLLYLLYSMYTWFTRIEYLSECCKSCQIQSPTNAIRGRQFT